MDNISFYHCFCDQDKDISKMIFLKASIPIGKKTGDSLKPGQKNTYHSKVALLYSRINFFMVSVVYNRDHKKKIRREYSFRDLRLYCKLLSRINGQL